MMQGSAVCGNRTARTTAGVRPVMNRAVLRLARAVAVALGNASEAACAAALRRHAWLIRGPPAERRVRTG